MNQEKLSEYTSKEALLRSSPQELAVLLDKYKQLPPSFVSALCKEAVATTIVREPNAEKPLAVFCQIGSGTTAEECTLLKGFPFVRKVRFYSPLNPDGSDGFVSVSAMFPITSQAFKTAASNNWNVDPELALEWAEEASNYIMLTDSQVGLA